VVALQDEQDQRDEHHRAAHAPEKQAGVQAGKAGHAHQVAIAA